MCMAKAGNEAGGGMHYIHAHAHAHVHAYAYASRIRVAYTRRMRMRMRVTSAAVDETGGGGSVPTGCPPTYLVKLS